MSDHTSPEQSTSDNNVPDANVPDDSRSSEDISDAFRNDQRTATSSSSRRLFRWTMGMGGPLLVIAIASAAWFWWNRNNDPLDLWDGWGEDITAWQDSEVPQLALNDPQRQALQEQRYRDLFRNSPDLELTLAELLYWVAIEGGFSNEPRAVIDPLKLYESLDDNLRRRKPELVDALRAFTELHRWERIPWPHRYDIQRHIRLLEDQTRSNFGFPLYEDPAWRGHREAANRELAVLEARAGRGVSGYQRLQGDTVGMWRFAQFYDSNPLAEDAKDVLALAQRLTTVDSEVMELRIAAAIAVAEERVSEADDLLVQAIHAQAKDDSALAQLELSRLIELRARLIFLHRLFDTQIEAHPMLELFWSEAAALASNLRCPEATAYLQQQAARHEPLTPEASNRLAIAAGMTALDQQQWDVALSEFKTLAGRPDGSSLPHDLIEATAGLLAAGQVEDAAALLRHTEQVRGYIPWQCEALVLMKKGEELELQELLDQQDWIEIAYFTMHKFVQPYLGIFVTATTRGISWVPDSDAPHFVAIFRRSPVPLQSGEVTRWARGHFGASAEIEFINAPPGFQPDRQWVIEDAVGRRIFLRYTNLPWSGDLNMQQEQLLRSYRSAVIVGSLDKPGLTPTQLLEIARTLIDDTTIAVYDSLLRILWSEPAFLKSADLQVMPAPPPSQGIGAPYLMPHHDLDFSSIPGNANQLRAKYRADAARDDPEGVYAEFYFSNNLAMEALRVEVLGFLESKIGVELLEPSNLPPYLPVGTRIITMPDRLFPIVED